MALASAAGRYPVGFAASLWIATKRINYEWRWERIPQYFAYLGSRWRIPRSLALSVPSPLPGTHSRIVITPESGGAPITITVAKPQIAVGDTVEGDTVGHDFEWRVGPLTQGLWVTIWISFVSGLFGLLIGLIIRLCRVSSNPALRGLAIFYIELIRGTPLLVQIFIFYFFIGTVPNLDRTVAYSIGALALFVGAYIAEIIRAGIESIHKGQTEAARSLG